ncbi:hypothetical protein [Kiloniella laminariae]|uniref:hypothetical protein n=1 Tax=Kiloniella laminariae TaxID=454162 RepID=UPI000361E17F|nr:hypothetical protein [Kiloniella laminariae]
MYVIETVSWNAKPGVMDQQMIKAVGVMVPDLVQLPGFLHQSLVKTSQGKWIGIYYWDTEANAHASNDLMAGKASLKQLVSLTEMESLAIEVMTPLQESTPLIITG